MAAADKSARQRPKLVEPNLLDRAIGYIAPKTAARRLMHRQSLALAGGWSGGSRGRAALRNWQTTAQDADGDLLLDLPMLRERSRDLNRNNPLAAGALGTFVDNVIGTGLTPRPTVDHATLGITPEAAQAWGEKMLAEWKLHFESRACDLTREQNFYGLQALGYRSARENGDVLVMHVDRATPGSPYTLAVQLVEADRVCNPHNRADTATLRAGVEYDADGAPIRYHVASRIPTQAAQRAELKWEPVDARPSPTGLTNARLLKRAERIGQSRGVPLLAPVIEPLKQLSRLSEAELAAAVVSGMYSVFVKMDPDAFESLFEGQARDTFIDSAQQWDGTLTTGTDGPTKAVNLLPGESIDTPTPGRPNPEFDPFFKAIVRQIGVGIGLPFEVLIKHFESSYSAARAALLDAWRRFKIERDWWATSFCQPSYEALAEEVISSGRLAAPGFFRDPRIRRAYLGCQWIGDGPGSIDPQKEIGAAKERVELGISTREAESIAFDGQPWEPKHRQLAKEEAMRKADGLTVPPPAKPGTPADSEDSAESDGEDSAAPDGTPGTAPAPKAPAKSAPKPTRAEALLERLTDIFALFGQQLASARAEVAEERAQLRQASERQADTQAALTEALIAKVGEPVQLESKVVIEQADTHFHQHAAPAVSTLTAFTRDEEGEITDSASLVLDGASERALKAAVLARSAISAAADASAPASAGSATIAPGTFEAGPSGEGRP